MIDRDDLTDLHSAAVTAQEALVERLEVLGRSSGLQAGAFHPWEQDADHVDDRCQFFVSDKLLNRSVLIAV
ncbi:MAG TPA: hypothetical protein VKI44_20155 [Acetobacteraceae bacterium]|nr:hypothetical protein [Acetobacteraceae bacterium]